MNGEPWGRRGREMGGNKGRYGNGNKRHLMLAIKCCLLYDVRDVFCQGGDRHGIVQKADWRCFLKRRK